MKQKEKQIVKPRQREGNYKIEKGVPLKKLNHLVYPLDRMDVNDSFFVPVDVSERKKIANKIASAAAYYCRIFKGKKKFTTRKAEGGVRCWRLK